MFTFPRTAAIIAGLTLVTASCGSSSESSAPSSENTEVQSTMEHNDDDVMFAQMMIPHHEQAIELADIALDPTVGAGDDVVRLAQAIKAAQDPEIAEMTSLLTQWGEGTEMDSSMDHGSMMSGMASQQDIADLSKLRGSDFDATWLTLMIAHHEGAIEMADKVLASGANSDVRDLATRIIAAQQAEIDEMRQLLA